MTEPRVSLITGASSGIGRATTLALIQRGDHVAGIARRAEALQTLSDESEAITAPHGTFLPLVADVSDAEAVREAVAQAVARFGRLDVVIANAGVGHRASVIEADWDDVEKLLRTNIDGVLHTLRAAVPHLTRPGGHVITISSVTASMNVPYAAYYGASKAFVSRLAGALSLELAPEGIAVSDFLLGRTQTAFNENRLGAGARRASRLPEMPPERVAQAILRTLDRPRSTVIVRPFDRLIVLGNVLLPGLMARLAKRQYK